MIWDESISFEGFTKKIEDWYAGKEFELGDPPIDAQFALEDTQIINSIKLDLILRKYSKEYRKYLKKKRSK